MICRCIFILGNRPITDDLECYLQEGIAIYKDRKSFVKLKFNNPIIFKNNISLHKINVINIKLKNEFDNWFLSKCNIADTSYYGEISLTITPSKITYRNILDKIII